jgi:hypothetical protein
MDGQLNEKQIMELFDGFTATPADDADVKGFDEPIKGKYEAEIKSIEYKDIKTKDGRDFEVINLKLKITKDVAGDVSLMRNVDKSYFMGVSQWNEDPIAGYKQLLNDLASAGLYHEGMKTGDIRGAVEAMGKTIVGKPVFLSMFPKKDKQQVRIVRPSSGDDKKPSAPASKFAV